MCKNMQLHYITVTPFSSTDLFLDQISLEWDSRGTTMSDQSQETNFTSLCHWTRTAFLSQKKGMLKIDLFVKMPWHRLSMGVVCSYSSAPGMRIAIKGKIEITSWKALCTGFSHSLVKYKKSHSFAALTRSSTKRFPCCNLFVSYILRFSRPQICILALDKFELRITRVRRKYYLVKVPAMTAKKPAKTQFALSCDFWLDEAIFSRVRNSFRLSDWSK